MSVFIGEFISNIVALYIFFLYLPHPCKSLVFLTAIHAGFSACDSRFQQLVVVVLLLELPLHKILESRNSQIRQNETRHWEFLSLFSEGGSRNVLGPNRTRPLTILYRGGREGGGLKRKKL